MSERAIVIERAAIIIARLAIFIIAPSKISLDSPGISDASTCIRPSHDHGGDGPHSFFTMYSRTLGDAVIIVGVRKQGDVCERTRAERTRRGHGSGCSPM